MGGVVKAAQCVHAVPVTDGADRGVVWREEEVARDAEQTAEVGVDYAGVGDDDAALARVGGDDAFDRRNGTAPECRP